MDENHQSSKVRTGRRRFQFRVTSWFWLIAILGWAIATWPWVYFVPMEVTGPIKYGDGVVVGPMETAETRVNPAFKYPAIALAAFVVWKAGWIAGQHSERQKRLDIADQNILIAAHPVLLIFAIVGAMTFLMFAIAAISAFFVG